ncbi:MAG: DUF58 domain-containing protein, partial [Acidimicrobiales bacterium]
MNGPGSAVALRKLELLVTRRLDGLLAGDYHGLLQGPGSHPAEGRPYEIGDDVRRIDWNLSARMVDPHVRTTEPDRELTTWIVVDRSASLDFGTADCEKRDLAVAATAAVGFLTARAGNRIGAILSGGPALAVLPPRSGPGVVHRVLHLATEQPRQPASPGDAGCLGCSVARRSTRWTTPGPLRGGSTTRARPPLRMAPMRLPARAVRKPTAAVAATARS